MNKKQKKMLIRIIIAAVLMIALHFAYEFLGGKQAEDGTVIEEALIREPLWFFLYLIPYLVVG